jgi:hypothetical protein
MDTSAWDSDVDRARFYAAVLRQTFHSGEKAVADYSE